MLVCRRLIGLVDMLDEDIEAQISELELGLASASESSSSAAEAEMLIAS